MKREMPSRNLSCVEQVMNHTRKSRATDVREVEDVLLAHLGLVPSLDRPNRPYPNAALDLKLAERLGVEPAAIADWLAARHEKVEERLRWLNWQSWSSDNQIIASVQAVMDECAAELGREPLDWKEHVLSTSFGGEASPKGRASGRRGGDTTPNPRAKSPLRSATFLQGLTATGTNASLSLSSRRSSVQQEEHLLLVCKRDEAGAQARLLQTELERR
eukprot:2009257-Prymnesium_polylepis.1